MQVKCSSKHHTPRLCGSPRSPCLTSSALLSKGKDFTKFSHGRVAHTEIPSAIFCASSREGSIPVRATVQVSVKRSWPGARQCEGREVEALALRSRLRVLRSPLLYTHPGERHGHTRPLEPQWAGHRMDTSLSAGLMKWFPEAPSPVFKVWEHLQIRSGVQVSII